MTAVRILQSSRSWTIEEVLQVFERLRDGEDIHDISRALQRTAGDVDLASWLMVGRVPAPTVTQSLNRGRS